MKCVYCSNRATTRDALGLDACEQHKTEANQEFENRKGFSPHADTHLYCREHFDLWQPECPRCEECCWFHYGSPVGVMFPERVILQEATDE